MKRTYIASIIGIILVCLVFIAGCSKYADPELTITSNISKISEDQATGNITYDISITIANTGENNAYQVTVLAILSTPKDLPEYRFVSSTIDVGDVPKGERMTLTRRVVLPATQSNYNLIITGSRTPEIDTKLTSVTSNIMG